MSWPRTAVGVKAFWKAFGKFSENPAAKFGPQSPGTPVPFTTIPQSGGGNGAVVLAAVGPRRWVAGSHS